MNINLLKLFGGHVVTMSEMSNGAKLQLLNYIQEASEYQVKVFLLDAEIMNVVGDEFCMEIIDQRFQISGIPEKVKDFEKQWQEAIQ